MRESQFQSRVLDFLRSQGIYFIKYWGGGHFTRAGVPDIIACVNGIFVAIELKTETGRVSKLQEYNLYKIRESGGIGLVLRPADFPTFQKLIREVKRCNIAIPEFRPSSNAGDGLNFSTSTSSRRSRTKPPTAH